MEPGRPRCRLLHRRREILRALTESRRPGSPIWPARAGVSSARQGPAPEARADSSLRSPGYESDARWFTGESARIIVLWSQVRVTSLVTTKSGPGHGLAKVQTGQTVWPPTCGPTAASWGNRVDSWSRISDSDRHTPIIKNPSSSGRVIWAIKKAGGPPLRGSWVWSARRVGPRQDHRTGRLTDQGVAGRAEQEPGEAAPAVAADDDHLRMH